MRTDTVIKERGILPPLIKQALPERLVTAIAECGAEGAEELRLHAGRVSRLTNRGLCYTTNVILTDAEMADVLKKLCAGSLYAHAESINQGYLTLPGGIRVGVCGSAALDGNRILGVHRITGLVIRIPHAISVSVSCIADSLQNGIFPAGLLFYSPPGVGKTTLLRALAAELSAPHRHLHTVIVDTRDEIAPAVSGSDLDLDILSGYPRERGIEIAVRTLSAEVILCDEIGSAADADALLSTANCGVPVIATAHAASCEALLKRPQLRRLHDAGIFGAYVGLSRSAANTFSFHFTEWKEAIKEGVCLH